MELDAELEGEGLAVKGVSAGLWSGEASGVASGAALGLDDDGTGEDGDREGVTVAAGGGSVE